MDKTNFTKEEQQEKMTLAYLLKSNLEKATQGELQETPLLHKEEDDNLKDLVSVG
jgi:hypothetical protein